jgi:type VI secretion system protein
VNEEYFEELDLAFSTRVTAPRPPVGPPVADDAPSDAIDWFSRPAPAPRDEAELPLAPLTPPAPPALIPPAPVSPAAQGVVATQRFPPLADAFAALLAAEQTSPTAAAAPVWPAATLAPGAAEDLVEQVTRRVLAQMSDRSVREAVSGIVSEVAERLVREEIERIKNGIS